MARSGVIGYPFQDAEVGQQEAATKWCEAMNVAGHYVTGLPADWASDVAVTLSDYSVKASSVVFQPEVAPYIRCEFHVVTSSFFAVSDKSAGKLEVGLFNHIERCIEWNTNAPWGQQNWKLICKIDGHSLSVAITEDEQFLKSLTKDDATVLNFTRDGLDGLTDAQVAAAQKAMGVCGPQKASSHQTPKALVVLAPSSGGKTSMCPLFAPKFGIDLTDVVSIDGSPLRLHHPQFTCCVANGASNAGVWHCAWPSIKKNMKQVKKQVFKLALEQCQDIIVTDTGSDVKALLKSIQELKTAGYSVSVLTLCGPSMEIMERGIRRELLEGKRYHRNLNKIRETWQALEPSIQAANGLFKVVYNRTGLEPSVVNEGRCLDGGAVPRLLWDDLSTAILDIPFVDIATKDVHYVAEGNKNVVVRYAGDNVSLQGKVLRFTKVSSHQVLDTAKFHQRIARHLFEDFAEIGSLVEVRPEAVERLDKALFPSRPEHRRHKHLDTSVCRNSGNTLVLSMRSAIPSEVQGYPVCTFELKPKCGIKELSNFPSRYQMLQVKKKLKGQISELSEYDPVNLFSADPEQVLCALKAAMRTPQNNMRAFIGHELQLDAEVVAKSCSEAALLDFEKSLKHAHLPDIENLLQCLALALASPPSKALNLIRRAQCWAAGETAHVVNRLFAALCELSPNMVDELMCIRSFESAIEGVQELPCDESGVADAIAAMQKLLDKISASGGNDPTLEKETVKWICRFLLGRTAFDLSLCVSLVNVDPSSLNPKLEQQLNCEGFGRLSLPAAPATPCSMWARIVLIDFDMKDANKIPQYAVELDDLQNTYMTWRSPCSTSCDGAQHMQIGGHEGGILFKDKLVWKSFDHRFGSAEVAFLQAAAESEVLKEFVPHWRGIEFQNGCQWIVMDNLLKDMLHPAVADLKIGRQTWASNASPEKVEKGKKKAKSSTSWSMGFRLVGAQYLHTSTNSWQKLGHKYGLQVSTEIEMRHFFGQFFSHVTLQRQAVMQLNMLASWFEKQREFAFYGSSLIFAYDTAVASPAQQLRVGMVDFAHVEPCPEDGDTNYLEGLRSIVRLLVSLNSGEPSG